MKVLVACEFSGVVRDAFRSKGHDAWSCDLEPALESHPMLSHISNNNHFHIQSDVREVLHSGWDLMIAHPPCTYLCNSGIHWNKRVEGRSKLTDEAVEFVLTLMNAPIPKIAIENPVGVLSSRIKKPDQIIQPYEYGDDASKATCLWLKNLPLLKPTTYILPRFVNGKKRWSNQTDSGQNKLGPSPTRSAERSITYQGIANAMAEQWS